MNLYFLFLSLAIFTLIFSFLFLYRLHLIQQECLKQISLNLDHLKAEQYLLLTKLTETNHKIDTFVESSQAFYGIIFLVCVVFITI